MGCTVIQTGVRSKACCSAARPVGTERSCGFSLVELMVVIAIILIILAIAIPSLTRSKLAANEASAVESVRQIAQAQASYAANYPDQGFAPSLAALGYAATPSAAKAGLLEAPLSTTGIKDGYTFAIVPAGAVPRTTYSITATPVTVGKTGQRAFCTTQDTAIRFNASGNAATCLTGNNAVQ